MTRTEQDIINEVVPALLAQGPSYAENGDCRYRRNVAGTMRKCAVGILIKDEYYSPIFEGSSVEDTSVQDALAKSAIPVDFFDMLKDLQQAHDESIWSECEIGRGALDSDGWAGRFTRRVEDLCTIRGLVSPV